MAHRDRRPYCEDVDEDGNVLEDTRTYAPSTVAPKEEANTSRTRNKTRRNSSSPTVTDSDSTTHPSSPRRADSRMREEESRDKKRPSKGKSSASRPQIKSSKTAPAIQQTSHHRRPQEQASFYGVSTPAGARPRATARPVSYYDTQSRPPLSSNRYWQPQPPPLAAPYTHPAPLPPPGAVPYPSFAPFIAPPPLAPPPLAPPPDDYLPPNPRPLQDRFKLNRPASAMGYRAPQSIAYHDNYEQENEGALVRRRSLSRRPTKNEKDRALMPPPRHPVSTRPKSIHGAQYVPPPRHRRHSVSFEDDSLDEESSSYQEVSPLRRYALRRQSIGSSTYDDAHYSTEVARPKSSRTSVYAGQTASTGSSSEDKMTSAIRKATSYQEEINGGPHEPLTADALRKATKTPSRSTKSSGSRQESGYGRSATTRTSVDNDEVNIVVKGMATLKVGNTEMECRDGAQINIRSGNSNNGTIRGGSDNASSVYDDRRTRYDRPTSRVRALSQAGPPYPYAPPALPMYDRYGQPIYRPPYDNWV